MNHPTRRADDRRPALPLRWGERFTLLLTGQNSGVVGQYGATWPGQPAEYERVNVIVEGTVPKLDDIEQYRMQMAGISTAALGYWKEGDTIMPDYDTPALRDVARLYAKYAELHAFHTSVMKMVDRLKNRDWQVDQVESKDAADLQGEIALLVCAAQPAGLPVAKVRVFGDTVTFQDARLSILQRLDGVSLYASMADVQKGVLGGQTAPDAVDAALTDAIMHGAGAFQVNGDGSTERVDWQRDALHPGYATPKQEIDK